jgi:hypothetical protein
MRTRFGLSVVVLALSACALPPSPSHHVSSPLPASGPYDAPSRFEPGSLRATLFPVMGSAVSFHVDRPAYVSVFEISPGLGITMIYPRFRDEALTQRAGTHTAWRSSARRGYDGWGAGGWNFFNTSFAGGLGAGLHPRIFFLIASERPLEVEPYIHSSVALRMAMGHRMFASSSSMMDGLAQLVVPHYDSDDWVTDMYMEWPEPTYQTARMVATHVIRCQDGRTLTVPLYVTACPVVTPPAPPVSDSSAVLIPGEKPTPQEPERVRPERGRGGDGRTGSDA